MQTRTIRNTHERLSAQAPRVRLDDPDRGAPGPSPATTRRPCARTWGALVLSLALAACQTTGGSGADDTSSSSGPSVSGGVSEAMKTRAQPAPAWLVGKFFGTNMRSGLQNIEMEVAADGKITGRVGDITADGQFIGNNRILWSHGSESMIERRGNGLRVVQIKDPANVTDYQRR